MRQRRKNPDHITLSSTPRFDLRVFSIILGGSVAFMSLNFPDAVCARRHVSMQGTGEFPSENAQAWQRPLPLPGGRADLHLRKQDWGNAVYAFGFIFTAKRDEGTLSLPRLLRGIVLLTLCWIGTSRLILCGCAGSQVLHMTAKTIKLPTKNSASLKAEQLCALRGLPNAPVGTLSYLR